MECTREKEPVVIEVCSMLQGDDSISRYSMNRTHAKVDLTKARMTKAWHPDVIEIFIELECLHLVNGLFTSKDKPLSTSLIESRIFGW